MLYQSGIRWWRFWLLQMFMLSTLVVLASIILFVIESHLVRGSVILFITIVLPAVLTTSLVYGGERYRSFCIGALFPAAFAFFCLIVMVGMWLFEAFSFARRLTMDPAELAVVVGQRCHWLFASCWAVAVVSAIFTCLLRMAYSSSQERNVSDASSVGIARQASRRAPQQVAEDVAATRGNAREYSAADRTDVVPYRRGKEDG